MATITDRDSITEDERKKIEALNKKQAAEFRRLLGDPPDPGNVPQSFWDDVQRQTEQELAGLLLLLFLTSFNGHSAWPDYAPPDAEDRENPPGEYEKKLESTRDKISKQWTSARAKEVSKGIVQRSKDMTDTVKDDWRKRIKAGKEIPEEEVDALTDRIFGPNRIDAIVQTEGNTAVVEGGQAGTAAASKQVGYKLEAYWAHSGRRPRVHCNAAINPCPICSPMEGLPESQWGNKRPGYCHPNCDCYIVYRTLSGAVIGSGQPGFTPGTPP